jgi:hypothetical protein
MPKIEIGNLRYARACSATECWHLGRYRDGVFPVTSDTSQKLSWVGTIRRRIGSTATPTVLLYAIDGPAYRKVATNTIAGTTISNISMSISGTYPVRSSRRSTVSPAAC